MEIENQILFTLNDADFVTAMSLYQTASKKYRNALKEIAK